MAPIQCSDCMYRDRVPGAWPPTWLRIKQTGTAGGRSKRYWSVPVIQDAASLCRYMYFQILSLVFRQSCAPPPVIGSPGPAQASPKRTCPHKSGGIKEQKTVHTSSAASSREKEGRLAGLSTPASPSSFTYPGKECLGEKADRPGGFHKWVPSTWRETPEVGKNHSPPTVREVTT